MILVLAELLVNECKADTRCHENGDHRIAWNLGLRIPFELRCNARRDRFKLELETLWILTNDVSPR